MKEKKYYRTRFWNNLIHRLSRGYWGHHTLAGGWCPICKAIYYYPGWKRNDKEVGTDYFRND